MKMKWTNEKLHQEALKYKTKKEFRRSNRTAYQIAWSRGILDKICSHMDNSYHIYWNPETLRLEALKYSTRGEFAKMAAGAYNAALKMGILDLICSHMNVLLIFWTKEMVQKEAMNYISRKDFAKNSPKAYDAAQRMGILDEVCAHMKYLQIRWTYEMIKKEALRFETRTEFYRGNIAAYMAAASRKILDDVCSHMKYCSNFSLEEKELFDTINMVYPSAKTLKDMKVKIEGKPHIYGFEIDIYVPELKLGIEFDGIYWHSFDGLKESRPHWPDEDIHNYHSLKDGWFTSKGITILHIKEEDWLEDKQACIDRCFEFLSLKRAS